MSTQSWSTRLRHDSDATWQEWRDEFITRLNALGSPLVADETNITPGAGARPGTNTEGGYAVYHLGDALHSTAPIYIRFGFGTGPGVTIPRVQATVGTTTDGSGVLGGIVSTIEQIASFLVGETTDTAKQSHFSVNEGFFGLDWKVQDSNANVGSFFVCRTCNSSGSPTGDGAIAHWGSGNVGSINKRQAYRYASPSPTAFTAVTSITDGALGLNPFARTTTVVGSDPQAMMAYTITPRVSPLAYICGVLESEAAEGSTFSVAMIGSTARTFLVMHERSGAFGAQSSGGAMRIAMLWE
jgi:hypothetical protein